MKDVLTPKFTKIAKEYSFIARLALYVFAAPPHRALAEDVQVISLRGIVSVETLPPLQAA